MRSPHRPALIGEDGSITFGELADRLCGVRPATERRVLPVTGTAEDAAHIVALACAGASVLVLDGRATAWEQRRAASVFDHGPAPAGGVLGLCTSGSNGLPKVVELDWRSALTNAASFAGAAGYCASDVIWISTPLAHLYGLGAGVVAGLLSGATVLLSTGALGPQDFSTRLVECGVTVLLTVPFLAGRYVRELATDAIVARSSALRATIAAGEPVPASLIEEWSLVAGTPLRAHFGLTEGGHITIADGAATDGVGRPLPDVEVAVDADGAVRVRRCAPQRPYRVIGDAASVDGWCATGDLGELDDRGNLHIRGRIGDRINVAGRKVDPSEVETLLRRCPGVVDCAVAGVTRARGEQIVAFVVATGELAEGELRARLGSRLSPYKLPRRFVLVPQIPRTMTGKIRRGELIAGLHSAGEALPAPAPR